MKSSISSALLVVSVGLACLALFWPQHPPTPNGAGTSGGSCPFGFTGVAPEELPAGHPPVTYARSTTNAAADELVLWQGGTIWTGDAHMGIVQAMLVDTSDGLVLGVGSVEDLAAYARSLMGQWQQAGRRVQLRHQDLNGAFLMPGFIDPHVHFLQAGLFLGQANLGPATTRSHFQQILEDHLAKMAAAQPALGITMNDSTVAAQAGGAVRWLQGGQWDEGRWGGQLPDKSWLDEVTGPDIPAILSRSDSHMAVCNSAALRVAGITADTPNPEGGIIDRDATGQPTGILREHAIGLIIRHIPPPSPAALQQALQMATDYALSRGVTAVNDLGRAPFTGNLETTWSDLQQVYIPAADAGELRMRIMAFTPLQSWSRIASHIQAHGRTHPSLMLHYGGVKEFADGSLGARTALMWHPYSDAQQPGCSTCQQASTDGNSSSSAHGPHEHGTRMLPTQQLFELTRDADAAGLTVAVHAIGDRAIDETLDVFKRVRVVNSAHHASSPYVAPDMPGWFAGSIELEGGAMAGIQGPRHRIEHLQHVTGPGVGQLAAALGVDATPNPLHLVADGELMQRRLGEQRAGVGRSYAFKTLLQEGLAAGFSTDWPVTDLDPLAGVFVCMHREDPYVATPRAWVSEEALPAQLALQGHTAGAAHAALLEDFVGTLRAGMRADFIVLSASPLEMQPGKPLPQVTSTYLDARCAWGCTDTTNATAAAAA